MSSTIQQTAATLEQHLNAIVQGDLERIVSDYSDDAVLFTSTDSFRGREAVRGFFASALDTLPSDWAANFKMKRQEVEGEVAFIFWEAPPAFPLATDTFVVREGKIVAQTFAVLTPG